MSTVAHHVHTFQSDPAVDTSRAWSIRRGASIDALQLQTRALRAPVGDEVRVRMRAVALNHRDLMFANGSSGTHDAPIVPASDGAGEVVAVGPRVASLRVGDRVASTFFPDWQAGVPVPAQLARALGGSIDGVLSQHATLPEGAWLPIPDALGDRAAATIPCAGVTAWHALFGLEPLPPGATVVLLGTGGVSIWALQLAKAAGYRVLLTSSSDAKLETARALGADATINYRRTPHWGEEVQRLTAGVGADRVLDIGGPDTVAQSVAALRLGGTAAIIGRLTGLVPAQFDPAALFSGMKRLAGVMVGSRDMARQLVQFVAQHRLQPVIDRRFDFAQARDAYAYLAGGEHLGKVVVDVDG
jgi:NADPH:quinone reductase-like Zn-dependent oxidoreductase